MNTAEDLLTTLDQKAMPGNAALVVVDVQNDFAAEGGFFHKVGADLAHLQESIPPLLRLIDRARAVGVLVIFVQANYDPEFRSAPMRERSQRRGMAQTACLSGTWGIEFHRVKPLPGDEIVVKHRYNGMIGTDLEAILKRHGIKSLLMTGISTDTCVESTARHAYFIDYYVTLVADCCAAYSVNDHVVAQQRFNRDYGLVVTSDEVIAAWDRIAATPVLAAAAG